nr:uncharacterized protein yjlb [Quercus suber]
MPSGDVICTKACRYIHNTPCRVSFKNHPPKACHPLQQWPPRYLSPNFIRSQYYSSPKMAALPTPLADLKTSTYQIPAHAHLPNTSLQHKPLLIYHAAFAPTSALCASALEAHLRRTAVVVPQWRYTMYTTTHFHSTTHEVLCISAGAAKLLFGGEENPGKVEVQVSKGDVVVVPAGVAHRLLEETGEEGFEMVGAYPEGPRWDMCYGDRRDEGGKDGVEKRIVELEWFSRDPIYGGGGPVLKM